MYVFFGIFLIVPVPGVVRPVEVRRTGDRPGGDRDWDHLGWFADCQRYGRECRSSLLLLHSMPKTQSRLR